MKSQLMRICISLPPPVCDCSLQNTFYPQNTAIFYKIKIPIKCNNFRAHQSIILKLAMVLTTLLVPLELQLFFLLFFNFFKKLNHNLYLSKVKTKKIYFLPVFFMCDREEVILFLQIKSSNFLLYIFPSMNLSLLSHFP